MTTCEKCVICGVRPVSDKGRCHICNDQIAAAVIRKTTVKPEKYITYRGIVVGLFRTAENKLRGRSLRISVRRLPKNKTINLDTYCPGYSRTQVKKMKSACLMLGGFRG